MKIQYYEVLVTCTGRSYGPKQEKYHIFDQFRKTFVTREEVRKWLEEHYGKCKRQKMYRDYKDAKPVHIGYVYCFNNADWSHAPVEKWRQQDWVEIRKVESVPEP